MEYPVYPEYKYSDIHWLEKIPTHWEVRRVKLLANETLQYGANEAALLDDKNMPRFIRITDVKIDGNLHENTFRSLPENIAEPFLLKEGDILLARSGATVGKSFKYSDSWGRAAYAGYLIRFRVNKEILIDSYAYAYFKSSVFWANINSTLIQSTIQNFSAEKYANIKIPFPDIQEQQKIADFLDYKTQQIDQLIEKKKALIEKLNEQRIAVITQAVTKGIDKNAKMKPSGVDWLGDVPEHWLIEKLKFSVGIVGGGTPNTSVKEYWDGDIPWVSPKDMKFEVITSTEDCITQKGLEESATNLIDEGEILIVVRSGILQHSIPVAINEKTVSLNQDMKAIIADRKKFIPEFLKEIIWSNQKSLLPIWSKPGCTVESIETDFMLNTRIALPPIDEQKNILKKIRDEKAPIEKMIKACSASIDIYAEYRGVLITSAVTGKIDVRDVGVGEI